jgi:hypothetical protein
MVRRVKYAAQLASCLSLLLFAIATRAQDASSTLYLRTDTDRTTVISPRVRVGADVVPGTRVDAAYSADVWTSASIDIATSASKAITEQRDQLDLRASQELGDTTLNAAYRFSNEPDYRSHGATLGVRQNLANNSTSLGLSASLLLDRVGRSGDPEFWRSLDTFDGRVSLTQLIDPSTWIEAVYELGYANGYLASPYRFIAIGPGRPTCRTPDAVCVREALPDQRLRHALALNARRALNDRFALGASYRFYGDGWSLLSHTGQGSLSFMPGENTLLALDYRFYAQSAAKYYQARVTSLSQLGRYATRDKELSPFTSHRLVLTLQHAIKVSDTFQRLELGAIVGPTLYLFSDFPPYKRLTALEATVSLGVVL